MLAYIVHIKERIKVYIERLSYENIGPIGNLNIYFRKKDNGTPQPLVIVGKNGSGKSILLSNIVDAFYELADEWYNNALQPTDTGQQYYKEISPSQIRIGQNYMVAHICFQHSNEMFEYLFKSGTITFDEYVKSRKNTVDQKLNWKNESNYKKVTVKKENVPDIFENSIVCFFGPNRYMKPSWMGNKYYIFDEVDTYSLRSNYTRRLNNPITAVNISELTLQWLFDVITDSRADLEKKENNYNITFPNTNVLDLLSISRQNVEQLMSAILGEDIIFRMGNRSSGNRRFSILRKENNTMLAPSLDALSTGQLSLFNLFATIIRYADTDNIDLSHRLNEIKGVVVIDEIELHLHARLQREVLPRLIALFPNVQFIITSHAPLFLLGMKEQFGDDGFDIIEMPSGDKISVEQFSEFETAYQYLTETTRYQQEIKAAIAQRRDKPLIITEGATDWKHMKAAYNYLIADPRCSAWLPALDFDFLEYEPENSTAENCIKLKMSGSQLQTMCEQYSLIKQPHKMIFIADCDVLAVKKALGGDDKYKDWGNSVYSFCLPIPDSRIQTPDICVEHLYSDEEIKKELTLEDGITRRIFMGNEFDKEGFSLGAEKYYCKNRDCCGPQKISIIDGSDKKKVIKPWSQNKETNYALSKMNFATYVLDCKEPFNCMDFSNFIPLFEIIRDILAE